MQKRLLSEIDIDATPARVWAVLTDFGAYPDWNPFITSAAGVAVVGQRVTMRMQPVGARGVTLRPTITQATEGSGLSWLGRLGLGGLFDAEHRFDLEARADGGTRLTQSERFGGLLVPFMARSLDTHTLPAFVAMNTALRDRAEQLPVLPGG